MVRAGTIAHRHCGSGRTPEKGGVHSINSAPSARSISAFLNAIEAALTACALIGPVTNWSISSLGIDGIAAAAARAAFVVFLMVGIHAPCGHAMPRTQNSR
jgi:hypothetical protein